MLGSVKTSLFLLLYRRKSSRCGLLPSGKSSTTSNWTLFASGFALNMYFLFGCFLSVVSLTWLCKLLVTIDLGSSIKQPLTANVWSVPSLTSSPSTGGKLNRFGCSRFEWHLSMQSLCWGKPKAGFPSSLSTIGWRARWWGGITFIDIYKCF